MMRESAGLAGRAGRGCFAASVAAIVFLLGGAFAAVRHRPLTFLVGDGPYYAATAVSVLHDHDLDSATNSAAAKFLLVVLLPWVGLWAFLRHGARGALRVLLGVSPAVVFLLALLTLLLVLAPYRGRSASHYGNRFLMPVPALLAPALALACERCAAPSRRTTAIGPRAPAERLVSS